MVLFLFRGFVEILREGTDVEDGINFCRLDAFQNDCLVGIDPLADISSVAKFVVLWILVENMTVSL